MEKVKIGGIMQSDMRSLIRLGPLTKEGGAAVVLGALGEEGINLELVVQSFGGVGDGYLSLVVALGNLERALALVEKLKKPLGFLGVSHDPQVAVISAFGPHLREKPRVPGLMLGALGKAGIEPLAIATSISSLSCVVPEDRLDAAVEALNLVFEAPFQVKKRPKDY